MALTQKFIASNRGSRKEDYIEVTMIDVTEGEVKTRLRYIDACYPAPKGVTGVTSDTALDCWTNYSDAGSTEANGSVFLENVATTNDPGQKFVLRCIGK